MKGYIQLKLRSWIFDLAHHFQGYLPHKLRLYILQGLPFGLSVIDTKSPLTDDDIATIEELVKKYGEKP